MNQPPRSGRFSPPWFLLIGLVAGAAFLVFMLADKLPFGKSKVAHSKHVIELTSENWKKEVVQSATPVVVDFWAPWCGPCVKLSPTIEKLAERYEGKVKFGKVNIDEQEKIAALYKISGIPCVMIFNRDEDPIDAIEGFNAERVYVRAIDAVLAKN